MAPPPFGVSEMRLERLTFTVQYSTPSTCYAEPGACSSLSKFPRHTQKGTGSLFKPAALRLRAFSLLTGDPMHSTPPTAHTTRPLLAAQWALTGIGLFCLVGAAVVMTLTPEAWPL